MNIASNWVNVCKIIYIAQTYQKNSFFRGIIYSSERILRENGEKNKTYMCMEARDDQDKRK